MSVPEVFNYWLQPGRIDVGFLGMPGRGPTVIITDLGILRPDPQTCELTLTDLHHGVEVDQARAATGWELALAEDLVTTPAPSERELELLRELKASAETP